VRTGIGKMKRDTWPKSGELDRCWENEKGETRTLRDDKDSVKWREMFKWTEPKFIVILWGLRPSMAWG
jgi:hypothetical protein